MRSSVDDILPAPVRRSLTDFGAQLAVARRRRRLTSAMMAERIGVSRATYLRMEKGDPTVSMGANAMAIFVLGFGAPLGELLEPHRDDQGLLLENQRLPKRIHARNEPTPR